VKPIPFQATKYNSKKINLSSTICPPYDVIDDALAQKLVKQSKYNSINLSFNVHDKHGSNKYSHITKLIKQWKLNKILIKDSKPFFYYLEEKFNWKGKTKTRSGIFALIPVKKNKHIIPHEKVFPEAVRDRLELLKSTKTHVSPIFLVFEDEKEKMHTWLKKNKKKTKLQKVQYKNDKINYRFGTIEDKKSILELQNILKNQDLADSRRTPPLRHSEKIRSGKRQRAIHSGLYRTIPRFGVLPSPSTFYHSGIQPCDHRSNPKNLQKRPTPPAKVDLLLSKGHDGFCTFRIIILDLTTQGFFRLARRKEV
jgi:uncharacterized protein (DUF1015 family)